MLDWNTLVREHGRAVFGVAWRILGHVQDAEDVAQEVFAEALRQSNGASVVCWAAWLRRMAACRAIDALRRRRVSMPLDPAQLATGKDSPPGVAEGQELEARLREAVAELAPREAEVFWLRYFEDLSYREIATTLGISPTAASTALYQARQRLEQMLIEQNP